MPVEKGNVVLTGMIDRVDLYEADGKKYLRIVDYKSGGKQFDLSDVFYGMNMQMLIYLFAIWQNGGEYYKNVTPAGILYFQAKNPRVKSDKITRDSDEIASKTASMQELRMHGMVLNNIDVVTAMENSCEGLFIPVSLDKNDSPEEHMTDTLYAGAGLCDEASVDVLVHEAADNIKRVCDFGVKFDKSEKDKAQLALTREGAHSKT